MRIIAGKWKGHSLKGPKSPLTRPTSDRLRETIFNILNAYFMKNDISLDRLRVLDAFAGTGALGLEALSRGAHSVTFIEKTTTACGVIRENINFLKAQSQCSLIQSDVLTLKASEIFSYDLLFVDPPYHQSLCEKALERFFEQGWLAKNAIIVVETDSSETLIFPEHFQLLDHRAVGRAGIWTLHFQ
ncbi:MAG: 16S rRNA (guanine(966)-N(2))-methyltransferase RsmD [Caedimonas sp.]|nr:16S rRNA (guanine(966)-N(2))-methyltransferase RsmD [Caedimonas sp.]